MAKTRHSTPGAALVLGAGCALLGSCSDVGGPAHHTQRTSAGGIHPDAGAGAGGPATGSAGGGGSAGSTGTGGTGGWNPGADSTWHAVGWAAPCSIEIADQPKLAVPPLSWKPCASSVAGCSEVEMLWDHAYNNAVSPPRVARWGAGYRVGVQLIYKDYSKRAVVYDTDGTPLLVWRPNGQLCDIGVYPTSNRVWIYSVFVDQSAGVHAAYVTGTYDTIATTTQTLPMTYGTQATSVTDDILALWVPGKRTGIYDVPAASATTLTPTGAISGYGPPVAVNQSVLLAVFQGTPNPQGWIWNHATQVAAPFLDPPGQAVPDIQSDGSTLVWIQAPPLGPNDLAFSGDLWTAPFVTEKTALQPTKRRPAPLVGQPASVASEGFYAVTAAAPDFYKTMHVYRLSDMQHWSFTSDVHIDSQTHVNADEVWYTTPKGAYRQKIAALGAGDPPP